MTTTESNKIAMPIRSVIRASALPAFHSPAQIPQKFPTRIEVQIKSGQARIVPVLPSNELPIP